MNTKTLKALRGSIEKWERIVDGIGEDDGPNNCPLCETFSMNGGDCCGCPVNGKSKSGCRNTPYQDWYIHHKIQHEGSIFFRRVVCPTCKKIALKEVRFLKSLLPVARKAKAVK